MTPETLAEELHGLIGLAVEDGVLDLAELRILCVGLAPHGEALNLFYKNEWQEYWPFEVEEAFASVALDDWLGEADRLSSMYPGAAFDEHLAISRERLRATVQAALRLIAVREPLLGAGQIVCLGEQGLGAFSEWYPVSFAHAAGGGELLPLVERREPSARIDVWGLLHEAGITLIYPQGEVDGLAALDNADGPSLARTFRFADMTLGIAEGNRFDEGIEFRMRDEVAPRMLAAGHTQPEWGYPADAQVNERLVRHLSRHGDILFDWRAYPDPDDPAALGRWHRGYALSDLHKAEAVVRNIAQSQGLTAVASFLERLPVTATDRVEAYVVWAECAIREKDWRRAWAIIETVAASENVYAVELRARIALQLGMMREGLAAAEHLLKQSSSHWRGRGGFYQVLLLNHEDPERAQALARVLVSQSPKEAESHYALAYTLKLTAPQEALEAFDRAMRCDGRSVIEARMEGDFSEHEDIVKRIEALRRHQALHALHAEQLESRARKVGFAQVRPDEDLDVSRQWVPVSYSTLKDMGNVHALVQTDTRDVIVAGWSEGLFGFSLDDEAKVTRHWQLEVEPVAADVSVAARRAYVAVKDGIRIVDLDAPGAWAGSAYPLINMWTEHVASNAQWVVGVHSDVADVYAIEPEGGLRLTGSVGSGKGSFSGAALHRGFLLLSDLRYGLVVVDLSEPERAQIVAVLGTHEEETRADNVVVVGDTALLSASKKTLLIDVSDPGAPKALAALPISLGRRRPLSSSASNLILPDSDANLWTVALHEPIRLQAFSPSVSPSNEMFEDRFEDVSLYGDEPCFMLDERLLRISEEGQVVVHEQIEKTPWEGPARIRALHEPIRAWLESQLRQWAREHPDKRIGVVSLYVGWGFLVLSLDGMRSRPGIVPWPACDEPRALDESFPRMRIEFGELVDAHCLPPVEPPHSDSDVERRLLYGRFREAWQACIGTAFADLKAGRAMADAASGRVFFTFTLMDEAEQVVDTYFDETKSWVPYRARATGYAKAAMQNLLSEEHRFRYYRVAQARAQRDPVDRDAVWALAAQGREAAMSIAACLADTYPNEARACLIEAAETGHFEPDAVRFLGRDAHKAPIRALLERALSEGFVGVKLVAAQALDRLDAPELLAAIEAGINSKVGADIANALDAAQALPAQSLIGMQASLLQRVNTCWDTDNDLPRYAQLLFRAGYPEAPERLLEVAAKTREGESEGGLFDDLIASLMSLNAADAERLWSARELARHILACYRASDEHAPLVPDTLRPEPHALGWKKLFSKVWPELEQAGALRWCLHTLAAHGDERAPAFARDAPLVVAALSLCLEQSEPPREAIRLISQAIEANTQGVYDEQAVRLVAQATRRLQLQAAWDFVENGDWVGARALADDVLKSAPSDPQVLFLLAYLIWKQDSARACERYLEDVLSRIDRPRNAYEQKGRARLLNLRGCVYDELKAYPDALASLEEAVRADPDEPSYLANLAEVHENLGNTALARSLAEQAAGAGFSSALITRLTRETQGEV